MKLMNYVSKSLGLVEFTWNEVGKSNVSVSYFIVIHFLVIASLIYVAVHHFKTEDSFTLETMSIISKTASHAIIVILCIRNRRNTCTITKYLAQRCHLLVNEFFCSKMTVVVVQLLLGITVIIFSNVFEWFHMGRCLSYIPRCVLYIFTSFSMYVVEMQFINSVLLLKQYFAYINSQLAAGHCISLTTAYPAATLKTLKFLHSFHEYLCDIAQLLNCVYSPVIILDIGLSFFRSTYKLYCIVFPNLGLEPGIPYIHSLIYRCFHWIKFIFLIYVCNSCTKNVSGTYESLKLS